jgi:hypothetical protein
MKEQIVSFETAKLSKEKKFPYLAKNCYYDNKGSISSRSTVSWHIKEINKNNWEILNAPTQSLLQKWLREEHNIAVYNKPLTDNSGRWSAYVDDMEGHHHITYYIYEATYEEALEKGLQEALKLI